MEANEGECKVSVMKGRVRTAVLLAVDIGAVRLCWPSWAALLQAAHAPHQWVASVGPDRVMLVLAAAVVSLAGLWLGVGLLALLSEALPGAAGRVADVLARRTLPAGLYRLCIGAVGVSILVGPTTASATAVGVERPPGVTEVGAVVDPPPPAWPTGGQVLPPAWPQGTNPAATSPATPLPQIRRVPPAPQASNGPRPHSEVTVRPGDSLWLIAVRRLGAGATPSQIDAVWREWYAANRALIGADPNVIHPGQVLVDPGGRSTSAASTEEAR
jgi:resuscitation-promoting factor RpfA